MDLKGKMRKKLLDLDELKKVNGGTFAESWDIVNAIDRNPYLSDMWDAALNEVCGWDIEDENDLFFCAAMIVLEKLGIKSSFRDDMGAGFGNIYKSTTNYLNMSHELVMHIINNYRK